jgi:hypothetical protein
MSEKPDKKLMACIALVIMGLVACVMVYCQVLVPYQKTKAELARLSKCTCMNSLGAHMKAIQRLGGCSRACYMLVLYCKLPETLSPNRDCAISLLGLCGEQGAVDTLADAARAGNPSAMPSLIKIGEPAVPAITRLLKDADAFTRFDAALALGTLGPRAKAAIPDLRRALSDPDADVRAMAAEAIRDCEEAQGTSPGSAVPEKGQSKVGK